MATAASASAGESDVVDQSGNDDGVSSGTTAVASPPPLRENLPSPRGTFLSTSI